VALSTLSEGHEAIGAVNQFYGARRENTKVISETGKTKDNLEEYWTK
jgi:hypothetical protein